MREIRCRWETKTTGATVRADAGELPALAYAYEWCLYHGHARALVRAFPEPPELLRSVTACSLYGERLQRLERLVEMAGMSDETIGAAERTHLAEAIRGLGDTGRRHRRRARIGG